MLVHGNCVDLLLLTESLSQIFLMIPLISIMVSAQNEIYYGIFFSSLPSPTSNPTPFSNLHKYDEITHFRIAYYTTVKP